MSVNASDRIQVARIFATRRCRELDHVPGPAPCNRCLAWTQRRVDELERAGVIRTNEDHANEQAIAALRQRLRTYRWRTEVAARVAAAGGLLVVARKARRRWAA